MTTLRRWRAAWLLMLAAVLAVAGTGCGGRPDGPTLTVYSATGLSDWYRSQFDRFTRETGIRVTLFEAGSGEVVSRVNSGVVWDGLSDAGPVAPADLLVTLPPFIQKAAKAGLLQPSGADTTGIPAEWVGPDGVYVPIANTALCFIVNPAADPPPRSWADLLDPRFAGKLQYSTPGEAGNGTAVLVLLEHLMGKQGALDYLAKLQVNNVGPSSSTAALQPKVSSGELLVANGDIQMNLDAISKGSNFEIFFPAMPDGSRTTVPLPYVAGVTAATRWPEEAARLLAFLLTDEAQSAVAEEASGIPARDPIAGQPSGGMAPARVLDGVTLWTPDWNVVLAELESDIADYQDAIG